MKNNRKRTIKRYRKRRIIPTLILFIIVLIMVAVLDGLVLGVLISNSLDSKILEAEERANVIGNTIDKLLSDSDSKYVDETIQKIFKSLYSDEKIIVQYNDGKIISSFDRTAELKKEEMTILWNNHELYKDINDEFIFFSDSSDINNGNLDKELDIGKVISYGMKNFNNDVVVIGMDNIWIKSHLNENHDFVIYVKNKISLTSKDIAIYVVVAIVLFSVVGLVGLILLVNVIYTIINYNRMNKALFYDEITEGRNWMYFKIKADKLLAKRRIKRKNNYAVIAINNVKYDRYCTCYGGDAGDKKISEMYTVINEFVTKNEAFARYTESLFGAMLLYTDESVCYERIEKLMKHLEQSLEDKGIHIGIYYVPETGEVVGEDDEQWSAIVEHYFHHSRIACNSIEDKEESGICVFDDELLEGHLWEHRIEGKMDKALADEEFAVYLQPKYDPRTRELKGAEALVRWISPEEGMISPGKFIPVFESNGFIMKLDDYMVEHVAKLQADWINRGYKVVPVSVNVSRVHFAKEDLAEHICQIIDKYNIPHDCIELELTESAFFDDKKAILSTISKMQGFGFNVSMDDFGSGYSSLNSLKDLPLDVLKLDAEFFRGEEIDKRGEIIVEKAIELAKMLNMETVAEGVEKENQVKLLADAGCDMIQGFYFDKPMPSDEYEKRMSKV